MSSQVKVQIVYRNYKKLHPLYKSYSEAPGENVDYIFPEVKSSDQTKFAFKLYRKTKKYFFSPTLISGIVDRLSKQQILEDADLIEYLQVVPSEIPKKPYIINIEGGGGLFNFMKPTSKTHERALRALTDQKCVALVCTSKAAKRSLSQYFNDEELEQFISKVQVIYPALPNYYDTYKDQISHELIPESNKLKLLFVGSDVYRKGLHELLEAFSDEEISSQAELYINSNADESLKAKYKSGSIHYFEPKFSHEDMIRMFFLPADLFVMPTHADTFGMVYLDSLSTGTPIVATKQFAIPEFLRDKENGFFVDSNFLVLDEEHVGVNPNNYRVEYPKELEDHLVQDLRKLLKNLVKRKEQIAEMKEECLKDFNMRGKFSVQRRNQEMSNIYSEAIQ